jgi:hypothetical protein
LESNENVAQNIPLPEAQAVLKIYEKRISDSGMGLLVKSLIHKYIPDLSSVIYININNKKKCHYCLYFGFLGC